MVWVVIVNMLMGNAGCLFLRMFLLMPLSPIFLIGPLFCHMNCGIAL